MWGLDCLLLILRNKFFAWLANFPKCLFRYSGEMYLIDEITLYEQNIDCFAAPTDAGGCH